MIVIMLHWLIKELIKGILQILLLLLINWLHLSLASALIKHPLFGMAWLCIPYTSRFKIGKNVLSNRMQCFNNKFNQEEINESFGCYKVETKQINIGRTCIIENSKSKI